MLFLAAIIYAGTISTSATHAQATFPQGSRGSVVGTRVTVERRFPPSIPQRNAVNAFAPSQERNKEQQDACSRLKLHRLSQNAPAPQAAVRCDTGPLTP